MSYDEHLISMAGGDGDTIDQLAAIEARANAATEGPWELEPCAGVMCLAVAPNGNLVVDFSTWTDGNYTEMAEVEALASFIAHARTDVPALLALVREQQARLDAVHDLANWAGRHGWTVDAAAIRKALTTQEEA